MPINPQVQELFSVLGITEPVNLVEGNDDPLVGEALNGGGGSDYIFGHAGLLDTLNGNNGNDYLEGGAGIDTINGGNGRDTAGYATAGGPVTVTFIVGVGGGTATGGDGLADTLISIDNVVGSNFNDTIRSADDRAEDNVFAGLDGNDRIFGGDGNDRLDGGRGNDNLTGGPGGDVLIGGLGQDTMVGGTGRVDQNGGIDNFVFRSTDESLPGNPDTIRSFESNDGPAPDFIGLSAIDANGDSSDGNQAFSFIGSAAFSTPGQVRAQLIGGVYHVEVNTVGADGAEMAILMTQFGGNGVVDAGDFQL